MPDLVQVSVEHLVELPELLPELVLVLDLEQRQVALVLLVLLVSCFRL